MSAAKTLAPCGTRAAYMRHWRSGEEIDDACRAAANAYTLRQTRAKAHAVARLIAAHQAEWDQLYAVERDRQRRFAERGQQR